ncbi:MAG TPA: YceI family protein [Sulfurimonas sp.]|nr:YceI family protein [Sulfurimonas sp.]
MKKLLLVLLLGLPLLAEKLVLEKGFVAAHTEMLMDSTIDILNTDVHADISIQGHDILSIRGKLWVEMDLFSSDEPDRDDHMDKTDAIEKFPLASYLISSITKTQKEDIYVLHGTLMYHGQEQAFMADAEIKDTNNILTIKARSNFLVSDYGVEMPCMVFMCVRDRVDIFAQAVLVRKTSLAQN